MGKLDSRLTRLERSFFAGTDDDYADALFRRLIIMQKPPEDRTSEEERWARDFDTECERHPQPRISADVAIQAVIRLKERGELPVLGADEMRGPMSGN